MRWKKPPIIGSIKIIESTKGIAFLALTLCFFCFLENGALAAPSSMSLTPEEAVKRALRNNLSIKIDRLAPEIAATAVKRAKAGYDPIVFGEVSTGGDAAINDMGGTASQSLDGTVSSIDVVARAGIKKAFDTGTTIEASVSGGLARKNERSDESGILGESQIGYGGGGAVTLRQAILRGADREANNAEITAASAERNAAREELRRKAEMLAAKTLDAYWELFAAQADVKTQEVGLKQSEAILKETEALITAGKQPEVEKVGAMYAVQIQRRAIMEAKAKEKNASDRLARLLGDLKGAAGNTRGFVLQGSPEVRKPSVDMKELEDVAFRRRGDHQALLKKVKARASLSKAASNDLLPRLDFAASVGVGRVSEGGGRINGLGGATPVTTPNATNLTWSVGFILEIPLGNRLARSQKMKADLEHQRAKMEVDDARQVIAEELKISWRNVETTWETLALTRSAVRLAQLKFENERDRYRAGKSSAQMLTLVQADLLKERLNLEEAKAKYNQSLVALRVASGTLVEKVKG